MKCLFIFDDLLVFDVHRCSHMELQLYRIIIIQCKRNSWHFCIHAAFYFDEFEEM